MNDTSRHRCIKWTNANFFIAIGYCLRFFLFVGLSTLQSVSAQNYCPPFMNCSYGAHISRVTIGTINNSSSCSTNGYADYTTTLLPDTIHAGAFDTITVLTGTPSGYSSSNLAFWIDFNKNNNFDSSEYFFMGSGLGTTFTKQILVSSSTPGGLTTMRVRRVLNANLNSGAACASFTYGETEDYPIYIKPAEVVISHVPFSDTLYSPSIELNANIKQINVGLNTTDSLGPRIWVRRYGTTTWKVLKGQMTSGNSTNGNWKFLIPFDSLGVRRNGCDSIQYYFVAQDVHVPPNIGYLPEPASHTSVLVQQSPPSELFGFRLKPRLKDTIYVSQSDCRYQSLSAVNGLFSEINARGLEGDLTVLIESDLSETGEIPLLGQRQNSYRIQIRPSAAVLRSLNASSANTGMIRLDSVQKFVIDGSFNGQGRYLRFSNSSANYDTICHVKLYNGCDSVLIQHSIFENALCTSVWLAWGQNKNIVFYNNLFRNTPTSLSRRHILSLGGSNTALVRKNEFSNFLESGIRLLSGNNWIIDSNHFYRSVTPNTYSYDCSGVYVMGEGHLIENNFIGGQAPFVGGGAWKFIDNPLGDIALIDIQGAPGTNAVVVRRNRIDNFIMSKTTAAYASSFSGIRCMNNKAVIEENIIGNPNDSSAYSIKAQASVVSGIYAYTAQPIIIRDNSVSSISINEANTSVASMYGIYGSAGSNPFTVDISRNKIFHLYNPWNDWTTITAGINTGGGVSNVVEANTIHDVQVFSGQINGIIFAYNGGSDIARIQRNRVYDIVHGDPSLSWGSQIGEINGILIQNLGSPLDIVNNQLSLYNRGYMSPVTVRGIYCAGPNSNTIKRILYNSVFIGGTASGDAGSAVVVAASNKPTRIANNIFYNKRTGGSTGHYEYWTTGGTPYYGGFSSTQVNNNLYVLMDTTKFVNWYLVGSSPFSNWKSFVHPEDSSYLKTTIAVPDTGFFLNAARGDLHIDTSGVFAWAANDKGRGIAGIDGDYDTTGVRSVDPFHPTDIGSDEFKAWHLPANATCIGGTRSFTATTPGSSFQWQLNSGSGYTNLANDNNYSGVTTSTLQITNVSFRWDGYHYRAIVNGSPADSFSLAVVDSIPISVVISGPALGCPGASLSFLAVPTNAGTSPSYQWQVNGVNVGSNSNTFTTSSLINNDQVHVIMAGSACSSPSTIASNTININITPLPPVPTVTQVGNTLNSSGATGNQWYLNGTLIAGATGTSYTPLVSGSYTVKVTVNGCTSAASAAFNFVLTAINAPVMDKNITMVPNPVRDQLFIRYNGNTTTLYFNLIDISGRKIDSKGTFTSTYSLDMRGLSAGLYVVQIVNSRNGDEVRRLIVKE